MSETDFASRLLPHLRGMASVCQFLSGPINELRETIADPARDGFGRMVADPARRGCGWLISLGFLYAPVCPCHYRITSEERELLRYALCEYRNVSRRPRRLCGIHAASATEALLALANRTIRIAQDIARVQLILRAKDQGLLADWHKRNLAAAWPAIRDELAAMGLPSKNLLEKYQVESDLEWGKVKRCWEKKKEKEAAHKTLTIQPPNVPAAEKSAATDTTALLAARQLAERLNQSVNAVDSFLRRYRQRYPDCFMETDGPRRNEPKYLYRVGDVWPALTARFGVGS